MRQLGVQINLLVEKINAVGNPKKLLKERNLIRER